MTLGDTHLKILVLLLCQRLLRDHKDPQAFPRHVPTLANTVRNVWSQQVYQSVTHLQLFERVVKSEVYLLLQPVVILDDACHHHVGALHVEGDLPGGFVLSSVTQKPGYTLMIRSQAVCLCVA